ncbi:hypothetical protein Catovirus_1_558 [Catovirus CTV1]|uniref:Uncharacterized protein n=1 Tax=Catovirus CTV1 TaxID=1977631 RepID=A0A1V0SA28_9VIRU|nr:hypothetical protein Catovirus_1_558 [Catovirus CTV1]
MSNLISQLETVALCNENLTKDKYYAVMTNEKKLRNAIYKNVLNDASMDYLNDVNDTQMLFFPIKNKLVELSSGVSCKNNYLMCTWISEEVFDVCGDNYALLSDSVYSFEIKDKDTVANVDKYIIMGAIKNPREIYNYLDMNVNRYVCLPILLNGNYRITASEKSSGHIGLYVIDKYLRRAYFFDPNGKPRYFEKMHNDFSKSSNNQRGGNIPRSVFDDIELTFNELSFLTNNHIGPCKSIINDFMKQYTKLISENLIFVEDNNFYKFIPNSNMLSASFDEGSCVTWTIIMDHLLQLNSDKDYEKIIEELCNLTIIDSQRCCYSYQCGLYNMLDNKSTIPVN